MEKRDTPLQQAINSVIVRKQIYDKHKDLVRSHECAQIIDELNLYLTSEEEAFIEAVEANWMVPEHNQVRGTDYYKQTFKTETDERD